MTRSANGPQVRSNTHTHTHVSGSAHSGVHVGEMTYCALITQRQQIKVQCFICCVEPRKAAQTRRPVDRMDFERSRRE